MTAPTILSPFQTGDRDVQALRGRLYGELLTPSDPRYDEARQTQTWTAERRPAYIVRAAHTLDVAEAVRFARAHDLPMAVRSGGHSLTGANSVDHGLVIDVSQMKRIVIDPERRIAQVGPGVTSGELAGPAHSYGLALTTGDTSSVGISGLTVGGGIGFMARKYGLTIDNLLGVEMVLADGRIVHANARENADLFWAVRGGGGNFGVVTEFEFQLAPVGQVYGGLLVMPATREVVRGYLDYTPSAPDGLSTLANLAHAPEAPFIPADMVGKPVLMIFACFTGDMSEGERAMAPLRSLAAPVADLVGEIPYPAIYDFTAHQAAPHGASVRSLFTDTVDDATIDTLLAQLDRATSPFSIIHLRGLGGAVARVPKDATAFANRDKDYWISSIAVWLDPEDDGAAHRQWADEVFDDIKHLSQGVYVNFLGREPERLREAYPGGSYDRLVAIKRKYDPENLFRINQNIRPR